MFKDFYDFYDKLASEGRYGAGQQIAENTFKRFKECQAILDFLNKNKGKGFSAKEIAKNLEIEYGKWSFATHSVANHCIKLIQLGKVGYHNEEYQIKVEDGYMKKGVPRYKFIDCCRKIYFIA